MADGHKKSKSAVQFAGLKVILLVFLVPVFVIIGAYLSKPLQILMFDVIGISNPLIRLIAGIVFLGFLVWFTIFMSKMIWQYNPSDEN